MWGGILLVAVIYVGAGFLTTYVNATARDDEWQVDWKAILTWPKVVF